MSQTATDLTIDVEDYFKVAALKEVVEPHKNWDNCPAKVDNNTKTIITMLDKYEVQATFFIVGWSADRFPWLAQEAFGFLEGFDNLVRSKLSSSALATGIDVNGGRYWLPCASNLLWTYFTPH